MFDKIIEMLQKAIRVNDNTCFLFFHAEHYARLFWFLMLLLPLLISGLSVETKYKYTLYPASFASRMMSNFEVCENTVSKENFFFSDNNFFRKKSARTCASRST